MLNKLKNYSKDEINNIMIQSTGVNYTDFEYEGIGFDYEALMKSTGYTLEDVKKIQTSFQVGNTPLIELKNLTSYARKFANKNYGARIFLKDEAQNLSGSFKARRAAMSIYEAKRKGYTGVVAATSGNYGAAVAAMAAREGLKCIIIQEAFDSYFKAQPEILEKARACEAYGAEVIQVSVGPELFSVLLNILDQTGYFNATLYSPYGIMGIETIGSEIAVQSQQQLGKNPEVVLVTHAGGGNLTGTARGLFKSGAKTTKVYGASVSLEGLHMASDHDFNLKSFTTGHTGFGVPFAINPDRSDVPRSAARALRYMNEYYTVNQGSVFFITEALAVLEGLERGPAGNTALAVAFKLAQSMPSDEVIVVQESEYTGAGKHHQAQLSFAKQNGIELLISDNKVEVPGKTIVLPSSANAIQVFKKDLNDLRRSYLKRFRQDDLTERDVNYLAEELNTDIKTIKNLLSEVDYEA